MKTTWISKKDIRRDWYIVDVKDLILGRAASRIAQMLIGKSKVNRVPNMDCGDHVIVLNASEVRLSSNKAKRKKYYRHTGYPKGLREINFENLLKKKPKKVIELAVKNMLPKTKLRDGMMTRLHVYEGENHKHESQKPKKVELKSKNE